jgi:hypothetical protein
MITHGPMSQGSVHNSWKLKIACILTRDVTHWACLGCSGLTCMTACSSSHQYPATSHSQWRRVGQHSPATINNLVCERDVSRYMRQMMVTPDNDWFSDPRPYLFLYSQSYEVHRLGPNGCISIDWFPYMNCHSVKSLKLLHSAFIFFVECSMGKVDPFFSNKTSLPNFWFFLVMSSVGYSNLCGGDR